MILIYSYMISVFQLPIPSIQFSLFKFEMPHWILIVFLMVLPVGLTCGHDQILHQIKVQQSSQELLGIKLQSQPSIRNIRITHSINPDTDVPQAAVESMSRIINILAEFLKSLLKVNSVNISFPAKYEKCYKVTVGPQFRKQMESDLHLFVTASNQSTQSFLAWASPCIINNIGRPMFGQVHFNSYYFRSQRNSYDFQKDIETTLHQIIHILGFSPSLFPFWANRLSTFTKNGYQHIDTDPINKFLSHHYGCPTRGAPLQDQGSTGSAGSHWERSVFLDEIMTATALSKKSMLSNLTLALLASTGWYEVNFTMANPFLFGKNKCGFYSKNCTSGQFDEYCNFKGQKYCNYDYSAISYCSSDPYSNGCMYYNSYSNGVCSNSSNTLSFSTASEFGYDSKCFQSNFTLVGYNQSPLDLRCYRFKCIGDSIIVFVADQQILCDIQSDVKFISTSKFKGYLQCPPDFNLICSAAKLCPDHCSRKGYCTNGKCVCESGYYGNRCERICNPDTHYTYSKMCYESCPANTYIYRSQKLCMDSCPKGTYIDNKECRQCPSFCKQCNGPYCDLCEIGTNKTNLGQCLPLTMHKSKDEQTSNLIGLVIIVVLVVAVCFYALKRYNSKRHEQSETEMHLMS